MKRIITCLSMLCMLVGLAMASPGPKALAASAETTLYGSISTGMRPAGIYSTTTSNPPTLTNLAAISTWKPSAGVYANGNYYLLSVLQMGSMVRASKLEKYDVNTWIAINSVDPGTNIPTTLAFNPKDGKTYGCYPTATNGFELGVLDLDKGTTTTVGALDQRYVALFADNGGKVYGIGLDGNLCQFNLETAAATVIGATGVTPSMDVQDACFDESTNTVYWFAHTAYECSLYTIDVNTGAATKVTDFPSYKIRWAGVFAKPAKTVEKPAFIAKMRTEFDKSSLTGKFIFTMPDKTESGEALTSNLSYKFFLNDAEYKTGEGAPGAEVEVPVTVPADGKYKFAVCAELDGASGLTTSIEKYIGQDSPKTPANLKAVKAEGSNEITISWDAVTEGVNGGYINTAAIKYSLVRQPDNVTVASDLTTTSFTDKTISAMNNYNYVLMATDGVKSSGAVTSNDVLAGEDLGVALPYENSFLGENGMGFFTTIDANEDGNTWRSNGKNVFYNASKDNDANDWLVSPIVKLEKGKAYHLTMALMVSDLNKQERFVTEMNNKAKELKMTDTNFVNPTGLPQEGQYSSAADACKMFKKLISFKEYFDYSKIWMDRIEHEEERYTEISNTNKLLKTYPSCDSGKTGYTSEAGHCITASAKRDGTRFIACVIGANDGKTRFKIASNLLDYGFNNFEYTEVITPYEELSTVKVKNSKDKTVKIGTYESYGFLVKHGEKKNYEFEINVKNLKAPLARGENVGEISVYVEGVEKAKLDLVALSGAKKEGFSDIIKDFASDFNLVG